ncbi:MAG TPA: YciI family protein [Solirubrobacterales bacterium]|jgi:hypothetical protein|nr:YciI family protein [Solirubrobacterales bacterium]
MQYLMLIRYGDEYRERLERASEAEIDAVVAEYAAVMEAEGTRGGAQLQPPETATSVRVDGQGGVLSGPLTEGDEALGGFYLFETDDPAAAREVAARIPAARLGGTIEVRPLVER